MKALVLISLVLLIGLVSSESECKDEVPYIKNNCNKCWCTGGMGMCHLMTCTGETHEKMKNCEVGTKYMKNCNECVCVKDLGTFCTDFECKQIIFVRLLRHFTKSQMEKALEVLPELWHNDQTIY